MKTWEIPEDVVFRDLDGEGIVLNLATGTYFGLNPTATRVWQMLSDRKSEPEIVAALVDEFEVEQMTATSDVDALLRELVAKGLLREE
jgi:hypothetical protein